MLDDLHSILPSGVNAGKRPIDVFRSKMRAAGGCIEWTGKKFRNGYGCFQLKGRYLLAHRVAYYLEHGVLPEPGRVVMHTCDNRLCCNPDHLIDGSVSDNIRDMHSKGRANNQYGEASPRSKLTADQVSQIKGMKNVLGMIGRDIGLYFGISTVHANRVASGTRWKHTQQ